MFGSFGWMELLLILIITLIIFGAGKLPQLGEGLGKAIKGFKKSVHEAETMDTEEAAPQVTRASHDVPLEQPASQGAPEASRGPVRNEAATERDTQEQPK